MKKIILYTCVYIYGLNTHRELYIYMYMYIHIYIHVNLYILTLKAFSPGKGRCEGLNEVGGWRKKTKW